MTYVWLVLFCAAVAAEAATRALIAVWFVPGTLLALVFSLLAFPFWVQLFAFAIASLGILFRFLFRRSLFRGCGHKRREMEKRNIDRPE